MALTSPGVEVTITDQSQYLPAPTNSVPLIVLATAQNKADASGTAVAVATTAANANKLFLVTSQRDLVNLYGKPFFYTTTNGTPIQGYELNEYGLLAAYSTLGVTNRAYILRADIDLASLVGQTGRPVGAPTDGTYWLDTTTSTWGINEFNATTGQFELQSPIVISDSTLVDGSGTPLNSIGNIGDYAVNALSTYEPPTYNTQKTFYYKTTDNVWVAIASNQWRQNIPCVQGTNAPTTLTVGDTFKINVSARFVKIITVPASTNNTVTGIAAIINGFGYPELTASVISGKLVLYTDQINSSGNPNLTIEVLSGTVLTDLGIAAGVYYQPAVAYGTSAEMPLWSASQTTPRPSGSVWIKVGSSGNGLSPVLSQYSSATASFINRNVSLYTSDWAAIAALDPTGGKAIPAGTVFGEYQYDGQRNNSAFYLWERIATGPTIITGTVQDPEFNSTTCNGAGPYTMFISVSVPGSTSMTSDYTAVIPNNGDAVDFVTAFQAADVPYVTASVTTDGAIQLTHTAGGVILLSDFTTTAGLSCGVIEAAGFVIGDTGIEYGYGIAQTYSSVSNTGATRWTTSGVGTGASFNIAETFSNYFLPSNSGIEVAGTGFAAGDTVTINGQYIGGITSVNNLVLTVATVNGSGGITGLSLVNNETALSKTYTQLSNWVAFDYEVNEGAPSVAPTNNTNWFYSVIDQVDIMVQKAGAWIGYKNTSYDVNGHPAASGSNATDPNGPIIAAAEPTTQSDGTALVYGDLWVNTSDLELYPVISRWQQVDSVDQWILVDNSDQTSQNGVTFLDARWATNGTTSPVDDPIPAITSLLTSNYLDLDAPNPSLYPQGMLLFNTRRSGYNVKQFRVNYFNNTNFPGESLPAQTSAWVSVSGNQSNGAAYMGRQAQRAMVVQSLRSAIDTNTSIRDEDNYFNLLATPNYPELQPNMVVLNADRGETGYILGDTPLGLADNATDIQAWANNDAGATSTGENGLVTRNTYLGLFYPSGITNDLSGNEVVVPASHMMLRTFLRNDTIAFPWLAAAGTRRGNIDNALNIGYLDRATGEFQVIKTRIGIRDTLYINQINPMVFFTGIGLLNYGNKNSFNSTSALDRTNVARLINYIRRQLTLAARPFVFEPNDALTRNQLAGVIQTLFVDLVAKRGIYDYIVICDDSNNTPARIDRNELWVDVAIEPVKAAEFIYIPVRVLNTGEIANAGA